MSIIFSDSFTDTALTALTAHTPDTDTVGNGYAEGGIVGSSATAGAWRINSAGTGAECTSDNDAILVDIDQADATVYADWTPQSGQTNRNGVVLRWSTTDNYWVFNIREQNGDWRILERNAGSETARDSGSFAWNEGTTYDVEFRVTGNDFDCAIDDTDVGSYTSAFNNTVQNHGLSRHTGSNSLFDNFNIDDQAAGLTVDASTEQLTLTAQAATVNATREVDASTEQLTLTGQAATVVRERNVDCTTEQLTLTAQAATVNRSRVVNCSTEQLTLTGQAASVITGGSRVVNCSTEQLTLTPYRATVIRPSALHPSGMTLRRMPARRREQLLEDEPEPEIPGEAFRPPSVNPEQLARLERRERARLSQERQERRSARAAQVRDLKRRGRAVIVKGLQSLLNDRRP